MATPSIVHSGDSAQHNEFSSYVLYVLTLIKAYSILVCTHNYMVHLSLLPQLVIVGRWKAPFEPKPFKVHPTNSQCVSLPMIGFEYINGLPPIHKGTLRPSVGIMADLVMSDLLIHPFSLREAYPYLERS